jgi:hypothetical protein
VPFLHRGVINALHVPHQLVPHQWCARSGFKPNRTGGSVRAVPEISLAVRFGSVPEINLTVHGSGRFESKVLDFFCTKWRKHRFPSQNIDFLAVQSGSISIFFTVRFGSEKSRTVHITVSHQRTPSYSQPKPEPKPKPD